MEVASTPAYHQQEFPRQISAMDAVCSLLARHVEACLKGYDISALLSLSQLNFFHLQS